MQYTASGRLCQSLFLRFSHFVYLFCGNWKVSGKGDNAEQPRPSFPARIKPKPDAGGENRPAQYKRGRSPPCGGQRPRGSSKKSLIQGSMSKGFDRFSKSVRGKKTKSRPAASKGERTFLIERGRGTLPKVSRCLKGDAAPRASCVVPARPSTACAAAPPLWGSGRAFCFAQ